MISKSIIVYKSLEKQIMSGDLAPGDKLPSEAKLCKHFDISRVSVRTALEKLCAIGLIIKKKGGGSFVKEQNIDNFMKIFLPTMLFNNISYLEMLELRQSLDILSVKLCLENNISNDYSLLNEIILDMETIGDNDSFFELDRQFHIAISELAGNKLLYNITLLIWDLLKEYSKEEYYLIGNDERITEHKLIFTSIVNNDVDLANIYTYRHLERTIKAVKIHLPKK